MHFRPFAIAVAVTLSVALAACGSPLSNSCAGAADVNPTVAALTDDLLKAEADGKIDRAKAAESMSRMLAAGQTYATSRDYRTFCSELAKIRHDSGL